jgi:hypothetical protein
MKKVGIMQPYFLPYLGYFSLIKHTDQFILFDPVQFIRHGWIERNRVLKQNEGWLYIKVPLLKQHGHGTLIKDTLVDNSQDWKGKVLAQLEPYKKTAPHYREVSQLVQQSLNHNFTKITQVNKATLEAVCEYLGFKKVLPILSKMSLEIETPTAPDEWAVNICKALGDVDEYWNPPGGQSFFNKAKYDQAGITLKFQKVKLEEYDQKRQPFEAGLSIVDILMFNSPETVNRMLDNYELI